MNANKLKLVCAALVALAAAGCGEVSRTGLSPSMLVIEELTGASGAEPDEFGGTLNSDVITIVQRTVGGQQVDSPTIFNDVARARIRFELKDQGVPGAPASPSALNAVTINRYRVTYRRTDGRNTPGVDVPYPFDSAVTVNVPPAGFAEFGFELVRHIAKSEAPLAALGSNGLNINTIAEVTFYGRDLAGHEISVTGQIGIVFANFGDPA